MAITAFIDESWSTNGPYIIGAALLDDLNLNEARRLMQSLRHDHGRKLHFHQEPRQRRRLIIESIAELELGFLVAISDVDPSCRPERRRRGALRNLTPQLVAAGVENAVFESRGKSDDQRDLQMLQNLRSSRELTAPLYATFRPGPIEPGLWIADFLCGSIAQHHAGHPELKQILDPYIRPPRAPARFEFKPPGPQTDRHVA